MQLGIESLSSQAQLIEIGANSIQKANFTLAEEVADRLFQLRHLADAIKIYQGIIQNNPQHEYHIDGLGNNEEQIGYYEWDSFAWYKEERSKNRIRGSPYDALSLCCMANGRYQAGIAWYKDLAVRFPKNYQIIFGYANILYNNSIYEEAINSYEQVAKLKPTFVKPLVDLALLYEYRRIQKRKSTQKAREILALDKHNQYALFILARNENDIDKKIKLLEEAWLLNVKYTRVCNQIGICYGGTKKHYEEAIKWYQKCTEINPKYSSCYNNIGVNNELLKRFEEAEKWYFRAVQADSEYKTAYKNLTDVFDQLKFQDEKIVGESKQYKVKDDIFCYYIGLSYYDKDKVSLSIKWIEKAIKLNNREHRFYNSLAISYDQAKDYDKAIENYKKCIQIQPSYYSAYYNLAIVYKSQGNEDEAINWYIKATEINPRYSYAYNNLGNIFKNKENFQEAIKYYEKAIEFNSTYTLAFINLGVCHLNLEQYKQASLAFQSAQEIVNTDNNNLSESNKSFIRPHLEKFQVEGYKWRQFGKLSDQNRSDLLQITKEFQQSLNNEYDYPLIEDKHLLTKQFKQILKLLSLNDFELPCFSQILRNVKSLYALDKNFFHIIPDYLFQFFWKKKFADKLDYEDIESELQNLLSKQIEHELASLPEEKEIAENRNIIEDYIKKYEQAEDESNRLNIFQEASYFTTHKVLLSEILNTHDRSKKYLTSFNNFVTSLSQKINRKVKSTVSTKISLDRTHKYASALSTLEQLFKGDLGDGVKSQITAQINSNLNDLHNVNLRSAAFQICNTWCDQLTLIFLKERITNNQETQCFLTNFTEGVCEFASIQDLIAAVSVLDDQSQSYGYQVFSFKNQLLVKGSNAILISLKNKDFTFSLRLELQSTRFANSFLRELRRIQSCAFGSIFECLLSVSNGRRYSLRSIAEHIVKDMQNADSQEGKELIAYASDVLQKIPTVRKLQ